MWKTIHLKLEKLKSVLAVFSFSSEKKPQNYVLHVSKIVLLSWENKTEADFPVNHFFVM